MVFSGWNKEGIFVTIINHFMQNTYLIPKDSVTNSFV